MANAGAMGSTSSISAGSEMNAGMMVLPGFWCNGARMASISSKSKMDFKKFCMDNRMLLFSTLRPLVYRIRNLHIVYSQKLLLQS